MYGSAHVCGYITLQPTTPKLCQSLGRLYAYTRAKVERGLDQIVFRTQARPQQHGLTSPVEIWCVLMINLRDLLRIHNGSAPTLFGPVGGGNMGCIRIDAVRWLCSCNAR